MAALRLLILCLSAMFYLESNATSGVLHQSIDVSRAGDGYVVKATMDVPVTVKQAWSVLTDFENLSRWVPDLTRSRVISRAKDVAIVEQTGTTKVGPARFTYTTEGSVRLKEPVSIQSRQIKGDMRRLESSIVLRPAGGGTRISYRLEVTPGPLASAALSDEFLRIQIGNQWDAIIAEMIRRARKG